LKNKKRLKKIGKKQTDIQNRLRLAYENAGGEKFVDYVKAEEALQKNLSTENGKEKISKDPEWVKF